MLSSLFFGGCVGVVVMSEEAAAHVLYKAEDLLCVFQSAAVSSLRGRGWSGSWGLES